MIVSEIPGTTRDSVDVRFELDGKSFVAIDTPGIRRTKSVKTDIDFYGTHRAQRSIRRSDVTLLFFDATERISKVDKQLCDYIAEQYRPCIFVVNKWDQLVKSMPTEKWVRYLHDNFPTMRYAPIAFITGQTGKNVKALLNHAQMLFKQSRARASTGQLNRMLRDALKRSPPPAQANRTPKIFYATQVGVQPPTIVLFCSAPSAISRTYQRYLLGKFRDELDFPEVPIKLYLRRRHPADLRDEVDSQLASSERESNRGRKQTGARKKRLQTLKLKTRRQRPRFYFRACIPLMSVEMAKVRAAARSSTGRWVESAINSAAAHAVAKQITSP